MEYDIFTVRGLIFIFDDGQEMLFEKDVWFSEFIDIKTGKNLIQELSPMKEFYEEWQGSIYTPKISREMKSLT